MELKCILETCSNTSCTVKPITYLPYIKNCLTRQINQFIRQYYQVLRLKFKKLLFSSYFYYILSFGWFVKILCVLRGQNVFHINFQVTNQIVLNAIVQPLR